MVPTSFYALAALCLSLLSSPLVAAQDVTLDANHNVTSLLGMWSSGSGAVKTGAGFANPVNFSFIYPATTGISYSFTTDTLPDGSAGYFEEAQYRFSGNGSRPNCIVGVVQWQHGTYTLQPNGSIILNPFAPDGRQQVQDMCASQSNIIQQFNQTTLFLNWNIYQDPQRGYKLQLYRFDGAPLSPMYLISQTPNMLPTQTLTANVTAGATSASSNALSSRDVLYVGSMLGMTGVALVIGLAALM